MTLLAYHGFEGYDNPWTQYLAGDLITGFAGSQVGSQYVSYQTGRNGGKAVKHEGTIFAISMNIAISVPDTAFIGFAFKATEYPQSGVTFINLSGGQVGYLKLTIPHFQVPAFEFIVATNVVVHQESIPYDLNKWYYMEVKYRIHDTLGVGELKMNEQVVSTYAGDTRSGTDLLTISSLKIGFPKSSGQLIDDLYICDDQGASQNNYLGDVRIDTIHPNGAGNYAQFTPSAGANYECVDEAEMDDTNYVSDLTVGNKDSYAYADVPTDLDDAAIYAVQIKNNAKRTAESDNIKLDPFIRTGAADYSQTAVDLPDEFGKTNGDITLLDPSDSNIWTQAKINACEFGMEVG